MKDREDEQIDAVLHALRTTEPAAGLEDRVLRQLESNAAERQPFARAEVSRKAWATWLMAPALGSCALVAVLLARHPLPLPGSHAPDASRQVASRMLVLHHETKQARNDAATNAAATVSAATDTRRAQVADDRGPDALPPLAANPSSLSPRVRLASTATPSREGVVSLPAQVAANRTSQGSSTREASFPAPELPLTEQERLLLRIAHRNDPVQIAMLDPALRALELAREHAEAKRFFAPPALPPELQAEIDAAVQAPYTYAHTTPTPERNLP